MTILAKFIILLLNIIYSFLKLFPPKKKVLFLSRQSNSASYDIIMLSKEIENGHPEYKSKILCKTINDGYLSKIEYGFHMLRQMYHLATSEAVVLDSYSIAVSILHHNPSLLVIQMWHSVGTMKKFGYSILDKPEGRSSKIAKIMNMHGNYDYIFAASEAYKDHLSRGFNYPLSKIITLPLPRIQLLCDKTFKADTRCRIFKMYPQLKEKKNIVYCPTFRKGNDRELAKAIDALIKSMDNEKYNIIIKVHPLSNIRTSSGNGLFDESFSSFEMLFAADIVISDYSCIIYEAAALDIPIYFYDYDYEKYMSERDLYIDYKKEMPGPICATASMLADQISKSYDFEKLHKFLNKYVTPKSDNETKDIVDFIFAHLKQH